MKCERGRQLPPFYFLVRDSCELESGEIAKYFGAKARFLPMSLSERCSAAPPKSQEIRRATLGHRVGGPGPPQSITSYRTTPSSGELAVAYNFFGMRPAR